MALLGGLTISSSYNDVGEAIVREAIRRGYTRVETVAVTADAIQESGLRPGAKSANGLWWGIYQQDTSYRNRDDPNENIRQFFDRLDGKRKSSGASPDIWLNIFWLQQRPGEPSAARAFENGRQAYLTEIKSRTAAAEALYDKYSGGIVVPDNRPDFNEYPNWTSNNQNRGGEKVDLILLHTQEGGGGDDAADDLGKYIRSTEGGANPVSYHNLISQASDGGTTVVNSVDTDYASWSVGNANNRSINYCFAGSYAGWTRDQWLKNAGKAIDVAAYLAVQDCKKYGISTKVVAPPYDSGKPGISDHMYVTKILKWGSHTDVGPGFPWDVFTAAVNKYAGTGTVVPPVDPPGFTYPSTDVMIREIWEQLRGPQAKGWPQLGGKSLVDAVASLTGGK